jgi:hypothetical protein
MASAVLGVGRVVPPAAEAQQDPDHVVQPDRQVLITGPTKMAATWPMSQTSP